MTAVESNRSYYPALDGLRGIAILLVVFLHNFGFMNYFFFGWLGVDLFFVLSGFLITDILLNSLGKPHFLRNFYMRRILRIFPLFYLILIICLFILPAIKSLHLDVSYYQNNQFWLWTYLQNWLFVFREPYGDKILLHTWSLAVEEQFYLVWPVTILLVRRPKVLLGIALSVLLLVVFARYFIWSYHIKDLAYGSLYTFTRIDGLCIGSMLALLMKVNPSFLKKYTTHIVLLMAAVNFGFYFINTGHSFTLPYLALAGYTTFAVLFGILVHEAVVDESKPIRFILNNRMLKFFGKISYGLYVYHWPVYMVLFAYFRNSISDRNILSYHQAELASGVLVTIIAVLISVASYRYFEKPFLKFKTRYST
jgi:peptidoglycan/LPS O-acetylase OafA/YrhL